MENEQISFQMISKAGEAFSILVKALEHVRNGNMEQAEENIAHADDMPHDEIAGAEHAVAAERDLRRPGAFVEHHDILRSGHGGAVPCAARDGRAYVAQASKDGARVCLVEADGAAAFGFADARVARIYGGTNEIMKEIISRSL